MPTDSGAALLPPNPLGAKLTGKVAPAPAVKQALPANPLSRMLQGAPDAPPVHPQTVTVHPKTITVYPKPSTPAIFHATPAELPEGAPARVAALNHIAGQISTAADATSYAKALEAMHITPSEQAYVSRRLGMLAHQKQQTDLHDLVHHVLPTLANVPLAAVGTDVKHVGYAARHPVARLENKGPFKLENGQTLGGNDFPFFGGVERGAAKLAEGVAGARTSEQAARHVTEAAQSARAEGFGVGGKGRPPLLKKGEVTTETGGELGAQVREGLKGAPKVRLAQKAVQGTERGKRVGIVQGIFDSGGTIEEAKAALKGAMPKVDFHGFEPFSDEQSKALKNFIRDSGNLRTLEKVRAIDGIDNAMAGVVPTRSEHALLQRVFGKEVSDQLDAVGREVGLWPKVVSAANLPRSILASTDLSAPFRQGLVAGLRHPIIFGKNFAPMLKAAKSEDFFQTMIQDEIHSRPTYPLMEKAKVAFTDIGKDANHGPAAGAHREEQFMSNYAERIPGFGRIVRGSDRAYVGFLNKMRADVFDHLVQKAAQEGRDVNDEKLLTGIGKFVNSATGRGSLGKLTEHTATLNAVFFSPRLLASRINFLNPVYYAKLDPFARKEALKSLLALGGTAATILEIAKMSGADINTDPTNADFAKIHIGNERVDILGGFQQPVRLAAQLYYAKLTSSTTGKVIPLGSGFAKTSRYDVVTKFLQGKFSPIPALVVDALKGQDFTGRKVSWTDLSSWEREAASHMIPFLAQDMYEIDNTSGAGAAAGSLPLDLFGVGVQDYRAKTPDTGTDGTDTGSGGGYWDMSTTSGAGSSGGGYWP